MELFNDPGGVEWEWIVTLILVAILFFLIGLSISWKLARDYFARKEAERLRRLRDEAMKRIASQQAQIDKFVKYFKQKAERNEDVTPTELDRSIEMLDEKSDEPDAGGEDVGFRREVFEPDPEGVSDARQRVGPDTRPVVTAEAAAAADDLSRGTAGESAAPDGGKGGMSWGDRQEMYRKMLSGEIDVPAPAQPVGRGEWNVGKRGQIKSGRPAVTGGENGTADALDTVDLSDRADGTKLKNGELDAASDAALENVVLDERRDTLRDGEWDEARRDGLKNGELDAASDATLENVVLDERRDTLRDGEWDEAQRGGLKDGELDAAKKTVLANATLDGAAGAGALKDGELDVAESNAALASADDVAGSGAAPETIFVDPERDRKQSRTAMLRAMLQNTLDDGGSADERADGGAADGAGELSSFDVGAEVEKGFQDLIGRAGPDGCDFETQLRELEKQAIENPDDVRFGYGKGISGDEAALVSHERTGVDDDLDVILGAATGTVSEEEARVIHDRMIRAPKVKDDEVVAEWEDQEKRRKEIEERQRIERERHDQMVEERRRQIELGKEERIRREAEARIRWEEEKKRRALEAQERIQQQRLDEVKRRAELHARIQAGQAKADDGESDEERRHKIMLEKRAAIEKRRREIEEKSRVAEIRRAEERRRRAAEIERKEREQRIADMKRSIERSQTAERNAELIAQREELKRMELENQRQNLADQRMAEQAAKDEEQAAREDERQKRLERARTAADEKNARESQRLQAVREERPRFNIKIVTDEYAQDLGSGDGNMIVINAFDPQMRFSEGDLKILENKVKDYPGFSAYHKVGFRIVEGKNVNYGKKDMVASLLLRDKPDAASISRGILAVGFSVADFFRVRRKYFDKLYIVIRDSAKNVHGQYSCDYEPLLKWTLELQDARKNDEKSRLAGEFLKIMAG